MTEISTMTVPKATGQRSLRRISPLERGKIVAAVADREAASAGERPRRLMLVGDGGVASQQLGEVLGVCAEAPLPRVLVREENFSLDGVCGIASMLQHWGLAPVVFCPASRGQASSLQQQLLAKEKFRRLALCTGLPQVIRHTRRVFTGGHQLAHLETEETIPPASAHEVKRGMASLMRGLKRARLLCIVDKGNAGLNGENMSKLATGAKASKTCVFYEPRTAQLLPCNSFDIVKVNHNQMRQWFGARAESDRGASATAEMVLARTGASSVIYTRGERGIFVCQRSRLGLETFLIAPEKKELFDLVSAGDVVTAALVFCIAKGYSLLQAACFAATVAEYSLDLRYNKHIEIRSILGYNDHQ